MFGKILFPVESGFLDDNTVNTLAWLSESNKSVITLLHSYSISGESANFSTGQEDLVTSIFKRDALKLLDDVQEQLTKKGIKVAKILVKGDPRKVITEVAESHNFDLIVMNNTRGFRRVFAWNISNYVSRHAHCPVIILPKKVS